MTAAPMLSERQEWTVDDLGELPRDLPYELINGRLIVPSPTALHQELCIERPWKVSVDLPALTTRRAGLLGNAGA